MSARVLATTSLILLATIPPAAATTSLAAASGEAWDIQDTSAWATDPGAIATGGPSLPLQRVRVSESAGAAIAGRAARTDNRSPRLRPGLRRRRAVRQHHSGDGGAGGGRPFNLRVAHGRYASLLRLVHELRC